MNPIAQAINIILRRGAKYGAGSNVQLSPREEIMTDVISARIEHLTTRIADLEAKFSRAETDRVGE